MKTFPLFFCSYASAIFLFFVGLVYLVVVFYIYLSAKTRPLFFTYGDPAESGTYRRRLALTWRPSENNLTISGSSPVASNRFGVIGTSPSTAMNLTEPSAGESEICNSALRPGNGRSCRTAGSTPIFPTGTASGTLRMIRIPPDRQPQRRSRNCSSPGRTMSSWFSDLQSTGFPI